jgi:hypothetical protein
MCTGVVIRCACLAACGCCAAGAAPGRSTVRPAEKQPLSRVRYRVSSFIRGRFSHGFDLARSHPLRESPNTRVRRGPSRPPGRAQPLPPAGQRRALAPARPHPVPARTALASGEKYGLDGSRVQPGTAVPATAAEEQRPGTGSLGARPQPPMHCDHSRAALRLIRGPGWGPGAPIGRIGLHPGPGAPQRRLQALSSCWGAGGEALQSLLFSSARPSGAPTLEPAQPCLAALGFHQDRISHRWPAWCPRRPRSPLGGLVLPPRGPVLLPRKGDLCSARGAYAD